MKKINHEQLKELIKVYYNTKDERGKKLPLLILGTYGIGKSRIVADTGKELAEQNKREFVIFNELTSEKRLQVFNNPEKYFVVLDIRLSEFDSSDIKGLPDFAGKLREWLEWKVPFFAKLLEKPESDGLLFFDEINLALPLVISSCYKILYDRIVNDGKISDNWLVLGCGNLDTDKAYTHDLAEPLKDRGGEVELVSPSIDVWREWAIKNGIDSRIVAYLSYKPSDLHNVNYESGMKQTTERGWARLSAFIKGKDDEKYLDLITGTAIGEGVAREFCAFCKIKDRINIEDIIKNPETLVNIKEIDILYFVVGCLGEKYGDKKLAFDKIIAISEVLDKMNNPEFVNLLWLMCSRYNPRKFGLDFTNSSYKDNPIIKKYSKYLLN